MSLRGCNAWWCGFATLPLANSHRGRTILSTSFSANGAMHLWWKILDSSLATASLLLLGARLTCCGIDDDDVRGLARIVTERMLPFASSAARDLSSSAPRAGSDNKELRQSKRLYTIESHFRAENFAGFFLDIALDVGPYGHAHVTEIVTPRDRCCAVAAPSRRCCSSPSRTSEGARRGTLALK
jgi:hypothetical protein